MNWSILFFLINKNDKSFALFQKKENNARTDVT
jgi:hypothetical protein